MVWYNYKADLILTNKVESIVLWLRKINYERFLTNIYEWLQYISMNDYNRLSLWSNAATFSTVPKYIDLLRVLLKDSSI